MTLIVLNADDFGASTDTVDATIECFERGALTSASIMPHMPAAGRALSFARENPQFSFGLHFCCVADDGAHAVAPPSELVGLANARGEFKPTNRVRIEGVLGRLRLHSIETELRAQLELIRDSGVRISHVDSHRHIHKLPVVMEAFRRVLPRFGVRRVRNVQNIYLRRHVLSPTYWVGALWAHRVPEFFSTTRYFYMPSSLDERDWPFRLATKIDSLHGSIEVGVHPGYKQESRVREREGLFVLADLVRKAGHRVLAWGDLPN